MLLAVGLTLVVGGVVVVGVFARALSAEVAATVRVRYAVTGTAKDVTLTYSTWQDGELSTGRLRLTELPWAGELETRGFLSGGSLAVTMGESGGTAACSVTVDASTVRTAAASGPFATATCDGF